MLRLNLYQKYGLCNGAIEYVRDIIYDEVMVRVKVVLPLLFWLSFRIITVLYGLINNDLPKLIPITPFTARIKSGKSNDHRIQIPLRLIWVLTIHKCQGLTLGRAVIYLGKKESYKEIFK